MCTTELQRPIYFMCAYILRYCLGTCEELPTVSLQHIQGGLIIEDIAGLSVPGLSGADKSADSVEREVLPNRICPYRNSSPIT